jgi:hypothetical protein
MKTARLRAVFFGLVAAQAWFQSTAIHPAVNFALLDWDWPLRKVGAMTRTGENRSVSGGGRAAGAMCRLEQAKSIIDSTAWFTLYLEQFKDGAGGFLPFWREPP